MSDPRIARCGFEEIGPSAEIHGFTLTDKKFFVDYSVGNDRFFEELTSEDGVSYHGFWGKPGEHDPQKTVSLTRYESKKNEIVLIGEWFEGSIDAGACMYRIKPSDQRREAIVT